MASDRSHIEGSLFRKFEDLSRLSVLEYIQSNGLGVQAVRRLSEENAQGSSQIVFLYFGIFQELSHWVKQKPERW